MLNEHDVLLTPGTELDRGPRSTQTRKLAPGDGVAGTHSGLDLSRSNASSVQLNRHGRHTTTVASPG
jgi:hypothetical protein